MKPAGSSSSSSTTGSRKRALSPAIRTGPSTSSPIAWRMAFTASVSDPIRFTDEEAEWEVVERPSTRTGGKVVWDEA